MGAPGSDTSTQVVSGGGVGRARPGMPPTQTAAWGGAGVTAACVAAIVAVAPGVGVGSGTRGSPTGALQATDASARPVKTTPTAGRPRAALPLSPSRPPGQ